MEDISFGLAKINIKHSYEQPLTENRLINRHTANLKIAIYSSNMSTTMNVCSTNSSYSSGIEMEHKCSSSNDVSEDEDDDKLNAPSTSGIGTLSQRRNMPPRASKENSMLKIKRRTIMKPTKRDVSRSIDFSALGPEKVKKIYMNQKLTNFRPSNLETIFEEPKPSSPDSKEFKFIGGRKIRRSLSCSDGLNKNKTIIKQRRAKIKKSFGRRISKKKISLNDFIDRLNKSMEEDTQIDKSMEMKTTDLNKVNPNTMLIGTTLIGADNAQNSAMCELFNKVNFPVSNAVNGKTVENVVHSTISE